MTSAGIDESNSNNKVILLPKDSYKTAKKLCEELRKYYKLKDLGVLITDSRTMPFRVGSVGAALGYAGFKGLKDYRGFKDIYGKILSLSCVNIADSLATTAVLVMGEGKEMQPLALITKPPIIFSNYTNTKELKINLTEDIYIPICKKIFKII